MSKNTAIFGIYVIAFIAFPAFVLGHFFINRAVASSIEGGDSNANVRITPITASIIEVQFDGDIDETAALTTTNWSLQSSTDSDYSAGVQPASVERFRSVLNADDRDQNGQDESDVVYRQQIYLTFSTALDLDATYSLSGTDVDYLAFAFPNDGGGTNGDYTGVTDQSFTNTFTFGDANARSKAIKLNQVGYNANATERYAYIGYWLGSGGALTVSDSSFTVYNASNNSSVLSGSITSVGTDDDSGENVYEMDISSLDSGSYYIEIPGIGRSMTFAIGSNNYNAFYTSARGLYHQRFGTELTEEYTDWTHGPCHTTVYKVDVLEDFGQAFPSDTPTNAEDAITLEAGWYDAADFDLRPMHLDIVEHLQIIQEIFGDELDGVDLNIPESSNDLPDVLDEALYGLGLWEQLQEPSGGVRAGVESYAHPSGSTCEGDELPYWTYNVNRMASYQFAAAAANVGRQLRDDYSQTARGNELITAAQNAYTWAEAQEEYGTTSPVARTEEQKQQDIERGRMSAAGALFAATGTTSYQTTFSELWPTYKNPTNYDTIISLWGMAVSEQAGTDASLQADVRARIASSATQFIGYLDDEHKYRNSFKYGYSINAGTATIMAPYVLPVIMAHHFDPQQSYIDAVSLNLDYQFGANPNGISWVTGLGQENVSYPLHLNSMYDDIEAPVPGLPIYGPHERSFDGGTCTPTDYWQCLTYNGFYPAPNDVPGMYQFAPWASMATMNEFTVWQGMGYTIAATAFQFATSGESLPEGDEPPAEEESEEENDTPVNEDDGSDTPAPEEENNTDTQPPQENERNEEEVEESVSEVLPTKRGFIKVLEDGTTKKIRLYKQKGKKKARLVWNSEQKTVLVLQGNGRRIKLVDYSGTELDAKRLSKSRKYGKNSLQISAIHGEQYIIVTSSNAKRNRSRVAIIRYNEENNTFGRKNGIRFRGQLKVKQTTVQGNKLILKKSGTDIIVQVDKQHSLSVVQ